MTTTTEKILERAAHYERLAAALRLAAHELNGHLTEKKQAAGVGAMLSAAVELREQQRATVPRPERRQRRGKGYSWKDRQAAAAARLPTVRALFGQADSLSTAEVQKHLAKQRDRVSTSRIGQVLRQLGAEPTGTGHHTRWVLATHRPGKAKKAKAPKRGGYSKDAVVARRQQTATLLASFDRDEPRPMANPRQAGVLIQHGYLKAKGDGFLRTAKEFQV